MQASCVRNSIFSVSERLSKYAKTCPWPCASYLLRSSVSVMMVFWSALSIEAAIDSVSHLRNFVFNICADIHLMNIESALFVLSRKRSQRCLTIALEISYIPLIRIHTLALWITSWHGRFRNRLRKRSVRTTRFLRVIQNLARLSPTVSRFAERKSQKLGSTLSRVASMRCWEWARCSGCYRLPLTLLPAAILAIVQWRTRWYRLLG